MLSLGTAATNKVSAPEDIPAAARLEVWDQQLVLIRNTTFEGQEVADVTLVAHLIGGTITGDGRCRVRSFRSIFKQQGQHVRIATIVADS